MATLWQQQDGGYMLFYIFNSTVVDWTWFFLGPILTKIEKTEFRKKNLVKIPNKQFHGVLSGESGDGRTDMANPPR